jgi:hypothetical protein
MSVTTTALSRPRAMTTGLAGAAALMTLAPSDGQVPILTVHHLLTHTALEGGFGAFVPAIRNALCV